DGYLEEADEKSLSASPEIESKIETKSATGPIRVQERPPPARIELNVDLERSRYANFTNTLGELMIFVPSADFRMGGEIGEVAPNERPIREITLTRFYISRYLITNADYEQFDRAHRAKRAPRAGDRHPVVYVSYLDA